MELVFLQLVGGLVKAMLLFLIASGLSLVFGVSRVINLAHASFYMLGAYLFYTVMEHVANRNLGYGLALVAVPVVVALLAGLLEMTLLRKAYKGGMLSVVMVTFGMIFLVEGITRIIWSDTQLIVSTPAFLKGAVSLGGFPFSLYYVPIVTVAPLVALGIWFLFYRTRWGTVVRAATTDREMLGALGVNVPRVFTITFIMAAWLAGLGGVLAAPTNALLPSMDSNVIIEAFAVVVIGGLGSIAGSFIAALLIGELLAFGLLVFPALSLALVFVVMAVVLTMRPWGLMGRQLPD